MKNKILDDQFLLSLKELDDYPFMSEPMSLTKFISTGFDNGLDDLFPHVYQSFVNWQKNHYKYNYIHACLGSGKSTFYNYLFVYKLYLWILLKNPNKYYGFSSNSQSIFGIVGKKDNKQFIVRSLFNVFNSLPNIFEYYTTVSNMKPGKIYYDTCNEDNIIIRLYYFNAEGYPTFVDICLLYDTDREFLLGKNLIALLAVELENKNKNLYKFLKNCFYRIDSRTGNENLISGLIVEKNPFDYAEDDIDKWIYDSPTDLNCCNIYYGPRWILFPEKMPVDDWTFIDLQKAEFTDKVEMHTIKVPKMFKDNNFSVNEVLRVYVGIPTSTIESKSKQHLRNIMEECVINNVKIKMDKGVFYFYNENTNEKLDISELLL